MKKVRIEDYYDGFGIIVYDGDKETKFYFDQEDTREKMVEAFKALGIDSEYESVY